MEAAGALTRVCDKRKDERDADGNTTTTASAARAVIQPDTAVATADALRAQQQLVQHTSSMQERGVALTELCEQVTTSQAELCTLQQRWRRWGAAATASIVVTVVVNAWRRARRRRTSAIEECEELPSVTSARDACRTRLVKLSGELEAASDELEQLLGTNSSSEDGSSDDASAEMLTHTALQQVDAWQQLCVDAEAQLRRGTAASVGELMESQMRFMRMLAGQAAAQAQAQVQADTAPVVEAAGLPSAEVLRGVAAAAEAEVAGPQVGDLAAKFPVQAVQVAALAVATEMRTLHRQLVQSLRVSAALGELAERLRALPSEKESIVSQLEGAHTEYLRQGENLEALQLRERLGALIRAGASGEDDGDEADELSEAGAVLKQRRRASRDAISNHVELVATARQDVRDRQFDPSAPVSKRRKLRLVKLQKGGGRVVAARAGAAGMHGRPAAGQVFAGTTAAAAVGHENGGRHTLLKAVWPARDNMEVVLQCYPNLVDGRQLRRMAREATLLRRMAAHSCVTDVLAVFH